MLFVCSSWYLHGPYRLFQRVKEFEAEAVFFGGSLDELTGVEQHRANPLTVLIGLVDEQNPRFQHTPQFGPALQRATDLKVINRVYARTCDPTAWTLRRERRKCQKWKTFYSWFTINVHFVFWGQRDGETHLQPVGHDDDGRICDGTEKFFSGSLLLFSVVLLLHLNKPTH